MKSRVPIVWIKEIRATKTRRFLDSIKPGVRACGPKRTPSFGGVAAHSLILRPDFQLSLNKGVHGCNQERAGSTIRNEYSGINF
jgi:hypothetical protein